MRKSQAPGMAIHAMDCSPTLCGRLGRSVFHRWCLMSLEIRRVKHSIRAWRINASETDEHLAPGRLAPIGEPIMIEPLEELRILRLLGDQDDMGLVSCRGERYLIPIQELDQKTIRIWNLGHYAR